MNNNIASEEKKEKDWTVETEQGISSCELLVSKGDIDGGIEVLMLIEKQTRTVSLIGLEGGNLLREGVANLS